MGIDTVMDLGTLADEVIRGIELELKDGPGVDQDKLHKILTNNVQIRRGMETRVEVFDPRTDTNEIYFLTQTTGKPEEVFLNTLSVQNGRVEDPRQSLRAQIYEMLQKAGFTGLGSEGAQGGSRIPGNPMARYHGGWSSAY